MSKLEHESAIRTLLAEYCHHYDDRRPEAFAALFTEDATFTVMGERRIGRDEIREHIGTQRPENPPGQHVTYNSVIEVGAEGTTARAWTDFSYLRTTDHGYQFNTAGRYHDRLVRDPDRWRIQTRTIVFLGDPVPEDI